MNDPIERIAVRFKSGNGVPVERAHITAPEWEELRRDAERYRAIRNSPGDFRVLVYNGRWVEAGEHEALDTNADLQVRLDAIDAARGVRAED